MSNTFHIRKVSHHHPTPQKQQPLKPHKLSITPTKLLFEVKTNMDIININKLILTNTSQQPIQYQLVQPKLRYFRVKFMKTVLLPGQYTQIFVFFNFQPSAYNLDDQLVLHLGVGDGASSISVPICVRTTDKMRDIIMKLKRESNTKENFKLMRLPQNYRAIGEKRLAGLMVTAEGKTKQQLQETKTFDARIQDYEKEYKNIQKFLKEKSIKCSPYRGQKPMTRQKYYQIIAFNLKTQTMGRQKMRQQILHRHHTTKSKNGPSIRYFESIRIQWNYYRNIPKITYQNGLAKLFKQVRSFVIYHRFKKMNKILEIYRNLREEENVQQPQTKIICHRFDVSLEEISVSQFQEDYNQEDREYKLEIQAKKKHNYYCKKIKKIVQNKKDKNLGSDFAQFTLMPRLLPIDEQITKNHQFQIKPRIGFDNWISVQQLAPYHHQLMNYQKSEGIPKWQCHPCFDFDKINRRKQTTGEMIEALQVFMLDKDKDRERERDNKQEIPRMREIKVKMAEESVQKREARLDMINCMCGRWMGFRQFKTEDAEVDFLAAEDEKSMQMDVLMPIKPSFHTIQQIKHKKQQYFPYYSNPLPSKCQSLTNTTHLPSLIYNPSKQDQLIFQKQNQKMAYKIALAKKIQNLLRFRYISTISEQSDDVLGSASEDNLIKSMENTNENQNQNGNGNWREVDQCVQEQDVIFERILDNISKVRVHREDVAHGKITSFNNFVKKYQNMIYF